MDRDVLQYLFEIAHERLGISLVSIDGNELASVRLDADNVVRVDTLDLRTGIVYQGRIEG